jgi:dethiobiotin synthetase/adenosylmethionine--8-amino-7-oxononanoate aminotransferase
MFPGMLFVDPLFQRSLVRVVRQYDFLTAPGVTQPAQADEHGWTGLPVMFDEVFTGLYRLGRFSSASFLGVRPDISVHAKLLTGGLLPLSITAASESIFAAFLGDAKSDALLHGHSYTAHPIGCHVANVSLQTMDDLNKKQDAWGGYKRDWKPPQHERLPQKLMPDAGSVAKVEEEFVDHMWSMWSQRFVFALSLHKRVAHVNALGSVLAVSLVDKSGSGESNPSCQRNLLTPAPVGYTSSAAEGLRDALLNNVSNTKVQIHSRVLGNVIYLIASMNSKPRNLAAVEGAFWQKLETIG